jgi:hypothetical protein
MPISTAPLKIQGVIIKYAFEVLDSKVYNISNANAPNGYGNATISKLITDAAQTNLAAFGNADLANMLLVDFLTCITSNIKLVWPESNLTVNTTNVIECEPVYPITIREFNDITNSILNTNYLTRTNFANDISNYFAFCNAGFSSFSDTTQ